MRTLAKRSKHAARRTVIALLASVGLLSPAIVAAREFLPEPAVNASATSHRSTYSNCRYGFAVAIPKGRVGYDETGPGEQSGVGMILSKGKQRAYLNVLAMSNVVPFKSPEEAAGAISKLTCKQRGGVIQSERQTPTKLGGLPAWRVVFECNSEGRLVMDESITLFHVERQMIYTIDLRADSAAYRKYVPDLSSLVHSFRLSEPGCR